MASELIAFCGLYCGACSFRLAAELSDRAHLLEMPSYYDHLKDKPLEHCPGCRLENKCGECAIRDCAVSRRLAHCGKCEQFPCPKLEAFKNDGRPHHGEVVKNLNLLREMGEERWLEHMRGRWTCRCGARMSWYHRSCHCVAEDRA